LVELVVGLDKVSKGLLRLDLSEVYRKLQAGRLGFCQYRQEMIDVIARFTTKVDAYNTAFSEYQGKFDCLPRLRR
jgi:hypothetical protein